MNIIMALFLRFKTTWFSSKLNNCWNCGRNVQQLVQSQSQKKTMGITDTTPGVPTNFPPQDTFYIQTPVPYNVQTGAPRTSIRLILAYITLYISLIIITLMDVAFYGWLGMLSVADNNLFGLVFFIIILAVFTLCVFTVIGTVKKTAALLLTVRILFYFLT
jgi:hypothetical protein